MNAIEGVDLDDIDISIMQINCKVNLVNALWHCKELVKLTLNKPDDVFIELLNAKGHSMVQKRKVFYEITFRTARFSAKNWRKFFEYALSIS